MSEAIQQTSETTGGSEGAPPVEEPTKGKIKFESAMPLKEAISYFEAIVTGLKQGTLHFKQGERSLTLAPAEHLEVEVKAARKGREEKVSFELAWRHEDESEELEISTA